MPDTPSASDPATTAGDCARTLWRHADFVKLWIGQTISVFGSHFTGLAMQFIAAVTLQATPAEMGILAAVDTAPILLIGLFAGVWVDRYQRRRFLIVSDLGRALLLATIPAAALAGMLSMHQLYVIGFLAGALTVFFDVAYQSYLPTLVDRTQLVEGNSKLSSTRSTASIAGLSIAGVVIQAITAPMAVILDVLSYLASALCLFLIRKREEAPGVVRASMLPQVREGIGVVFGNPLLRAFAGCMATSNFSASAFFALYILFGTSELGLGAAALGFVYGVGIAGAVIGALVAGWTSARLGIGRAIIVAAFLGAVEVVPVVFATPVLAVPLLLLSSLLGNFGWTIFNVNATSLRQAITPSALQGRMNATLHFIVSGMLPLGGLVGGALGQMLGMREAITLAAFGSLLSFLWVLFSPVRGLKRIPEAYTE